MKIAGVRKAIKLTTTTTNVPAGKTLTLKLKPKGNKKTATAAFKKIETAVKKGKKVTVITLKIVDAAGNRRTVKPTVKLTE